MSDSGPTDDAPPPTDRVAANAVITSLSTAAAMISGGVLAVLVAVTIGNNARTDGFFAAFAVYSTLVSFAQSSRTTIIARLVEGERRFGAFNHYLGAGILIMLVVSVAFGPLGGVVSDLLTGDLPEPAATTARDALLVLWPAACLQLFSALGAAMLGALGDFLWPGMAFVGGSVLSIAIFVLLQPSMGIISLPIALLVGSVASAAVIAVALARAGWRPARETVIEIRSATRAAQVLTISSVSFLLAQLGFIVTLALGARLGVGVITVFTYAYMAMGLLQALFVSSVPMVLAVPLRRTWDGQLSSLLPHHEAILRAGLLLSLPTVAAAVLIGDELGGFVLADFTASEVRLVIDLFVILSVNLVWGLAQTVPYAVIVGIGRYGAVALATAGVVGVQIVLAFLAAALDNVELLAASIPASGAVSALATFVILSRRYLTVAGPRLVAILCRLVVVTAVAFGAPALVVEALAVPGGDVVALLVGALLFALLVGTLLPAERDIARRLAAMVPRRPGARAPA